VTGVILVVVAAGIFYFLFQQTQSSGATAIVPEEHQQPIPADGIQAIEYFWRPGCPFCARLGAGLKAANIPMNERNIWENPADADIVRSVADGNETVPTVIIGPVGMVNPSVAQVQAALEQHAPHLL